MKPTTPFVVSFSSRKSESACAELHLQLIFQARDGKELRTYHFSTGFMNYLARLFRICRFHCVTEFFLSILFLFALPSRGNIYLLTRAIHGIPYGIVQFLSSFCKLRNFLVYTRIMVGLKVAGIEIGGEIKFLARWSVIREMRYVKFERSNKDVWKNCN